MLSTQRFFSRIAAGRVHRAGGTDRRAAGKRPSGRRLRLERLEERTVLSGGVVTTSITGDDRGAAGFVQSDGDIVVGGYGTADFEVVRYNSDGTLDGGFGNGGAVTTNFKWNDYIRDAAPYPGGKIVAGGPVGEAMTPTGGAGNWGLARYNSDGSLDRSFGGNGKVSTRELGGRIQGITVQPDGSIVAAGSGFKLARYTSAGQLDSGFRSGGIVQTDFGGYWADAYDVTMHQGKILAVGEAYFGEDATWYDFALARYNIVDGSLDTSFGTPVDPNDPNGPRTGKVTTSIYDTDEAFALAVYPDVTAPDGTRLADYIVVAGTAHASNVIPVSFALARYCPDGTLDPTFEGDGIVVTSPFGHAGYIYSVAIQPDGKIVAAGKAEGHFALARYNTDGSLDAGFGTAGLVLTPILNESAVQSVAIQSDGKIVAMGSAIYNAAYDEQVAVARYNPDGTLDETFGVVAPSLWISDGPGGLSGDAFEGNSGTKLFSFGVTLSAASDVPVTVQYTTADGSAKAGSDYVETTGTLTFSPGGPLTQTISVQVIGDSVKEPDETFYVNLFNPVNATIGDGQGVATIRNDDGGKPHKGSSAGVSAADLFFLELALNSENDNHKSDPLAIQAADELALMLVE